MANEAHLARLKEGMTAWNQWRKEHYPVLRQRCALAFQRVWGMAAPAGRQGLQTLKETGRKTFDRLSSMPWQAIASRHWKLFLVIVAVIAVGIIWKVPQWQAAGWQGQMEPKDLAKLQNDARTTLIQALGGAVLLIGLYFTLKNLQLTQDRQITEHYTRAVEQLGSDKLEVRLGAIYALERIAKDSERDHWPIMEILTAYVRENAPWKEGEQRAQEETLPSETQPTQNHPSLPKLATDIQAILTVVGRRTRTYGQGEDQRLNLSATDLHGADLWAAHLEGAYLWDVHLEGAGLTYAHLDGADLENAHLEEARLGDAHLEEAELGRTHLEGADLSDAHLEGAYLWITHLEGAWIENAHLEEARLYKAHLEGAYLRGAHLEGAHFRATHLEDADLWAAHLEGADLRGAHLEGAIALTVEQLSAAKTLYKAIIDPPLREQIEQQYPHLLEEP
jgi:uncharacterized protein YjbI with pentapeptide repeats